MPLCGIAANNLWLRWNSRRCQVWEKLVAVVAPYPSNLHGIAIYLLDFRLTLFLIFQIQKVSTFCSLLSYPTFFFLLKFFF